MKTAAPRRKDPQWEALAAQLDVEWSYRLAKRMEKYKTNPVLGYRTAGSRPAPCILDRDAWLAGQVRLTDVTVEG